MTDTGQVPGEGLPDSTGMVDQQGLPAPVPVPPSPATGGYAFQDLVDDPAEPEDEELLLMPSSQGAWSDPQVVPPVPAFPEPAAYGDGPYAEYPQQAPAYPQPVTGYPQPVAEAPHGFEPAGYPQPSFADPSFAEPSFPDPASYGAGAHEAGGRDSGALDLGALAAPPAPAPVIPAAPAPMRRPLHMGPPVPEATGGVVRSLADRGPAATPAPAQAPVLSALSTPAQPVPVRQPGPPTTGPEYLDAPRAEAAPQSVEIPVQAGAPWAVEPVPEQPAAAPAEAEPVAVTEPGAEPAAAPEPEP
ncbi:5,6-dimethylbenzimidazole synthase, partial [Streptomyces sp. ISL-66]|nr:5,6-dimethylbenzimidazole synthase [Streptomyces sp. ISL-66]